MFLVAALATVAMPALGGARAAAAGAGGTQPGSSPAAPSASALTRTGASTGSASLHVRSVRISAASCTPASHCSANPRQVSTHGTLLLSGVGLKAGMVLAFPRAPGARISRVSPAARLRNTRIGLLATVPASAHSGHIKILLSHGRYTSSYGPIYVYRHAL